MSSARRRSPAGWRARAASSWRWSQGGPKGRIQAADIEARAPEGAAAGAPAAAGGAASAMAAPQDEGTRSFCCTASAATSMPGGFCCATARPRRCPVLGIDLPGHGGSAATRVASFDEMVEAVAAALAAERVEAMHLAGHSLGGAVAAALAARDGSGARSLFLIAPAGLGPEINGAFLAGLLRARTVASLAPWLARLVTDPHALGPSFVRLTLGQLEAEEPGKASRRQPRRSFQTARKPSACATRSRGSPCRRRSCGAPRTASFRLGMRAASLEGSHCTCSAGSAICRIWRPARRWRPCCAS